ncbi:putative quinol monooxygenase [Rhodococcus spongiicola]|uniref:Antibiotic biosynthesis monooxygenase n=1 Tax=Rhodococcus spongiicola TaxID=2487352 RepID=A0A3S3BJ61_9NOCA|nr:putative quinol monooxygenase [Rhodococcus spongiicola]RVW02565.1 antibiotic biosynthesis monooxygenase [Rhodococcus spongiicola]
MSNLHVVATIPAKPGSEDTVRTALTTLVDASRREDGCVSYDLYESTSTPGTFVVVEVWTDQHALDAHMKMPHFQEAASTFGAHLAGAPGIHPLRPIA